MSIQQYVTEEFVGKNRELRKIQDDIFKSIKESWNEKLGYVPLKPMALITVCNPKSNIIESIGFSEPNDILNNRYGALLAGQLNNGTKSIIISDDGNVSRTLIINSPTSTSMYNRSNFGVNGPGMRIRIGSNISGSPVLRTDFTLNDPFLAAPESNYINITQGGWLTGSQTVVTNGLLSNVTTSGVIGECGLFGVWIENSATPQHTFMMSHDIAGASFSSGQNVNVTYTWSIT